MPQLTWLVTGCSSGFGAELVHSILARGDRVVATARGPTHRNWQVFEDAGAALLELDVSASQQELEDKIHKVIALYGGIDVLVNNAGYLEVGFLEVTRYCDYSMPLDTSPFHAVV